MNFPFLWRHCRFFPCTLPCSPKVHDVDCCLQGRFVVHFLASPQSQFVLFTTLGGSCSQPFVGVQPCASLQPRRHSTDGRSRLACDSVCPECCLVRRTSSLVRASEVKPHTGTHFGLRRQRQHLGCMFPTNLKHRQSSKTLQWKACRMTIRWRARLPFMIAAMILAPLGVQSLNFWSWETSTAKRRRPVGRGTERALRLQADSLGMSGSFRFRSWTSRSQCRGGNRKRQCR